MSPTEHFPSIETPRLQIRPVQECDADAIFKLYSSPVVLRYTDNRLLESRSESLALIRSSHLKQQNGEMLWRGLELKGQKGLCGTLRLYHFDTLHQFASLGCLLAEELWNLGLMTEALEAFCSCAFKFLQLNRIEAQIFIGNAASVRLFNKLNFTFEGELRENFLINGKFENSALFSILKSDIVGL